LVSVLPFLFLKDLAQLVRRSRRFCSVMRKERSRRLTLFPAVRSIPFLMRSSLMHHIALLSLETRNASDAPITRATLQQLRMLPQLAKLVIRVHSNKAAAALLHGVSSLQSALPTSLRAFAFNTRPASGELQSTDLGKLGSAFLVAAASMQQLTELRIENQASWDHLRLDALVGLPKLRTLMLHANNCRIPLSDLRALSQLRKLELERVHSKDLVAMCQPPHSLQLETLTLHVDWPLREAEMRALMHLPSLTELQSPLPFPEALLLLPQLPCLRRLNIVHDGELTVELTSSLLAALARSTALDEFTLLLHLDHVCWPDMTKGERKALWGALLRGVPNLAADIESAAPLFAVLPIHFPRMEQLSMQVWDRRVEVHAHLVHSTPR
jgi:hypothetical protein